MNILFSTVVPAQLPLETWNRGSPSDISIVRLAISVLSSLSSRYCEKLDVADPRLANPSVCLSNIILIQAVAAFDSDILCLSGFLNCDVEDIEVEEVRSALKRVNYPLVIPLTISAKGMIGIRHLVMFYITENSLAFYDSKGRSLETFPWKEGKTLYDLALLIVETLGLSSEVVKLEQNGVVHQNDVHNCGTYSLRYLYGRIVLKKSHDDVCNEPVSWADICAFRVLLAGTIEENIL